MRFIDFFAGIGGFRRGMELAGHECAGFCEFDKFAASSYISMHLITDSQRQRLAGLTLRRRQKEILKEEYRNGEWYADDIRTVDARSLPEAECWCFGAPCQDFSIAGKRAGLDGGRSSLIREVFRLLEEQEEKDRPEWLIYENVKGMLSSNRGLDYLSILSELDRLGYDLEWQNIDSAWYVPHHRERIYTVGHLRRHGRREILPVKGADGEHRIRQIGNYLPTRKRDNPNQGRIYAADGPGPCLNKMDGGGRVPSVALPCFCDMNYGAGIRLTGNARTLQARYDKGISKRYGENSGVCIPVLAPDRTKKRQNGRRFKKNGEPMFTLTGADRHGVGLEVLGGLYANVSKDFNRGICEGKSRALKSGKHDAGVAFGVTAGEGKEEATPVGLPEGYTVYAVWHEEYQRYIAIRRLTPKECFRLHGWTDDYFEKAKFVNSDNQLYKQAGNGVTVPAVWEIGERIGKYG